MTLVEPLFLFRFFGEEAGQQASLPRPATEKLTQM